MRPGKAVGRDSRDMIAFILTQIITVFFTSEQKQTLDNLK